MKRDEKEIRLITKKHKKQTKKIGKSQEDYKTYNHKKQKTTKLQKRKEYELNKRRKLLRKQTGLNK